MGIVVNELAALRTPCTCYRIGPTNRPEDLMCFSRGICGTLDNKQDLLYCTEREIIEADGIPRRVEKFREAVRVCQTEIAGIPRGERLTPWLSCMGKELRVRGIEV